MTTRIVTGIVGISIAIIIFFLSHTIVFNLAFSFVAAVIVRELFRAEKCTGFTFSYILCMAFAAAMPLMTLEWLKPYRYLFAVTCIMLLFVSYLLNHNTLSFDKLSFMIATTTLVSLSISCLIVIKDMDKTHGVFYTILTVAAAWISDAAAYFVGTFFGKHKLAPTISPKKTVEGALGGIILTGLFLAVIAFGYEKYMETQNILFSVNYIIIIALGMACSILGIVGDLSASLLKRQCQIKDYGNIMPGHGGMLDRFDSVLFVAPFMVLVLEYVKILY